MSVLGPARVVVSSIDLIQQSSFGMVAPPRAMMEDLQRLEEEPGLETSCEGCRNACPRALRKGRAFVYSND